MANSKLKCRGCKERFPRDSMLTLPGGNFHSFDCATEYGRSNIAKGREKQRKAFNAETKKKKKNLRETSLSDQHDLTQPVFNRMRVAQELKWFRDRGLEPECISCGKKNMDWCCGHHKTVGSHPELRYDERNTFLQCNYRCNLNLSGNIEGNKTTRGYKQGLFDRFGAKEAQSILDYLNGPHSPKKYTCQQLIENRAMYSKKIRELKND